MKINPTFLEMVLLLIVSASIYIWVKYGKQIKRWGQSGASSAGACDNSVRTHRKTARNGERGYHRLPRRPRRDWSEIKDPRGAKKQIDTTGYACLHIWCQYFGNADAVVHALVSDDFRGKTTTSCICAVSAVANAKQVGRARQCIASKHHCTGGNGHDRPGRRGRCLPASRIVGIHPDTISNWVERAGQHSARLQERVFFQAIHAGHIQLDELFNKVKLSAQKVWV